MWEASAPSNIALIKYMGKRAGGNIAVNPSISWTLDHLRSFVQLEVTEKIDMWESHPQWPLEMSTAGQVKYIAHLNRVKKFFDAENYYFKVRSGNNFPADCGIASSASSFAALTLTAAQALSKLTHKPMPSKEQLADLSRQGSGSSCRSFFSGFVTWKDSGVQPLLSDISIYHQVVIVSGEKKQVSSSEAHQRVQTSLLMQHREERVQKRFMALQKELQSSAPDWQKMYEITWAEYWDMHALFETSAPSFGYMTATSLEILQAARELWQQENDGPLVTMDAGPNVHLLWRADQKIQAQGFAKKYARWKWIEETT
jgi:diphosphomevalonate decarboxylase